MNNKIDINFYYVVPKFEDLPKYVQHKIDKEHYINSFQHSLSGCCILSNVYITHYYDNIISYIELMCNLKDIENKFYMHINNFKNDNGLKKTDFFKYVVQIKHRR